LPSRQMPLSRIARVASITFLLALSFVAGETKIAKAAPNTITFDGAMSGVCGVGTECCQTYTLTINNTTTEVLFHLVGDGTHDDCFDATCWESQSHTGVTFTHPDVNLLEIIFSPAPATPYTISFSICASVNCWSHFAHINWNSNDDPTFSNGQLPIYLCGEGGYSDLCGGCDRVDAFNDVCYSTVCFEHFSSGPLGEFSLHFNPPLRLCNLTDQPGQDNQQCNLSYLDTIQYPHGWKYRLVAGDGGYETIIFDTLNSGYLMEGCSEVCIAIPHCATQQLTTVTVTDGGYECLDSGASLPVPMKTVIGNPEAIEQLDAEQNYPNPVDASSGFKTTIPFATSAQGMATIRIVNEKGVEVLKDNENVSYAGKHFFYITAADLPAGTYYYQIEFPKGVVIQNNTMLVVK